MDRLILLSPPATHGTGANHITSAPTEIRVGSGSSVPDNIFEKVLQRVQRCIGGVTQPSTLVQQTPPSVTLETLKRLKNK